MAAEDFRSRIIISAKSSAERVFNKTAQASQKVVRALGSVAAAGAAAGAATAGAFAVTSVKRAATFQTGIAELGAITGAVGEDLEFLSDKAKAFGQASTFGATQAAEAFKLVASAKPDLLANREALAAVTGQVILLSEATGETLAASAKTVGEALNQFGEEADQAGRFVQVLAAGAKFGSSEVVDTAAALKKAGVAAAGAKVSFEATNAAIQVLAGVGIKGAEAGTALRGVLLRLQTQAVDKFNPAIVGVNQALENLGEANLSATEKAKLFGQENFVAASALIENADKVKALTGVLTGTSVATEQAAKRQNTFEAQTKLLSNAFEVLQIEVGEKFLPVASDVVKIVTQIIKEFTTQAESLEDADVAFSTLDETIRGVVATFTGVKTIIQIVGKAIGGTAAAIVSALSGNFADIDDILIAAFEDIKQTASDGFEAAIEVTSRSTPEKLKSALAAPVIQQAAKDAGAIVGASFFEGVATPTTEAAQKAAQAQLDDLAARVENIRQSTLTEVEAETERFEAIRGVLFQGKLANLEDAQFFLDLEAIAVAEHQAKLTAITLKETTRRKTFEEMTAKGKTKFILGQLQAITAGAATENKILFRINQAAAIGNAIINTAQGITEALKLPPPLSFAMAAVTAAVGAAQIASIASAKPGGGTTPSVSASVPTLNNQPVLQQAPVTFGDALPGEGGGRQVNIVIQGIPESGVMPAEAVRDLMRSINEELGDGANLNVSGGGSGGT